MPPTYYDGMRDSEETLVEERPENWRAGILWGFPNGDVPLTGLTALMPSDKINSIVHHWFEQKFPTQRASVTGRFEDPTEQTAVNDAADPVGTMHYWRIPLVDSKQFRPGHLVLARQKSDLSVILRGLVRNVIPKTDGALVATESLEVAPIGLSNVDDLHVYSNANAQGATRPEAISSSPEPRLNYTQIFRNSLDLTRTAMETQYRTGPAYRRHKKETLLYHGLEIEKALIYGKELLTVGPNGKTMSYMRGVLPEIQANGHVSDYRTSDELFNGVAWNDKNGGRKWMDVQLEQIFTYGSKQRVCYCGNGALLGIQEAVLGSADMNYRMESVPTKWGMNVRMWITPFGDITLQTHPLFSQDPVMTNTMMLFEPANMMVKYITDTMFKPDTNWMKGGGAGVDGKQEEFLTEMTMEYHSSYTGGFLTGIGLDNPA